MKPLIVSFLYTSGLLLFAISTSTLRAETIRLPEGTEISLNPDSQAPLNSERVSVDIRLPEGAHSDAEFADAVRRIQEASGSAQEILMSREQLESLQMISNDASGIMYRLKQPINLDIERTSVEKTSFSSTMEGGTYGEDICLDPHGPGGLGSQVRDVGEITDRLRDSEVAPNGRMSGESQGVSMPANLDCQQEVQTLQSASGSAPELTAAQIQSAIRQGVSGTALQAALASMREHASRGLIRNSRALVVTDFSRPSSENRMHVIEIDESGAVNVTSVKTSHGQGSDPDHDGRMNCFSSRSGGHGTPGGAHVTGGTYVGSKGYSLRLHGLESGNANTCSRAVVIHPANYVSWQGTIGRSYGCPALDPRISRHVIDTIEGGTFVYHHGNQGEC